MPNVDVDSISLTLPYRDFVELVSVLNSIPDLVAKVDLLERSNTALRSLYLECLDRLSQLKK